MRTRRALLALTAGLFTAASLGMVPYSQINDTPPSSGRIQKALTLIMQAIQPDSRTLPPYIQETRIRRGDRLATVLHRLKIEDATRLQAFLTQTPSARRIYKLYPGRAIQAATNRDGQLIWLRYIHTPGAQDKDGQMRTHFLEVTASDKGYAAQERTQDTERRIQVATGHIQSSLFAATDAAGIPDSVTLQMADILSTKIDFLRNLRQGDQFRVVYETRTYNGHDAGAGRVLALEFENHRTRYSAVWFTPPGKTKGAYYDLNGANLHGTFLRTALKFTRISATFGKRKHPIHKIWIGHMGVDYAAPLGTPIHSTADGVVTFAGVQRGYGNVVIIKHSAKFSTLYAHQSRIAPNIKKGVFVAQGDVIGQVGMTGWATGPHLHYEFRINGKPVDPLSVALPTPHKLDGKNAIAFAQTAARYKLQFSMLAQFQHLETQHPSELVNRASHLANRTASNPTKLLAGGKANLSGRTSNLAGDNANLPSHASNLTGWASNLASR